MPISQNSPSGRVELFDGSLNPDLLDPFFAKHPKSQLHLGHFKTTAAAYSGVTRGINANKAVLEGMRMQAATALHVAKQNAKRAPENTAPVEKAERKLAQLESEIKACQKAVTEFPRPLHDEILEWLFPNRNREYLEIPMPFEDYNMGDARAEADAEQKEFEAIYLADDTDADVKKAIHAWAAGIKDRTSVGIDEFIQGGHFDRDFRFVLWKNPTVALPSLHPSVTHELTADGKTVEGNISADVPDILALMLHLDGDALTEKFVKLALSRSRSKRKVPRADKPGLMQAQWLKMTEAQRKLEAAFRAAEASGEKVFRPAQWPAHVMLWLQPKTITLDTMIP
jgi:hypothetical protein